MGYQLQYISTTDGAFDVTLAANATADSVIEQKFLSTSYFNTAIYFGVDYADVKLNDRGQMKLFWYNAGDVDITSYWTLNEEHTVSVSASEYRWNGVKIYDTVGTVGIPSTPRFRTVVKGHINYFKITTNGVDAVNLVAWNEDGTLGLKDLVSGNFYTPATGTWTAGPRAHIFNPSKSSLTFPASGGSLTFDVEAETTWTASTPTFVTLSPSTGASGTTTVTATCPSYTGTTKREETITFTDNDSYTFNVKIRQRALTNGISNLYLGEDQIPTANAIYLGDTGVNTIYLGEEIVYSSGPFVGLKASPKTLVLTNSTNTANITIRSSENWTITDDSGGWLSYSTTTGGTGKTVVSVTASGTQTDRTATITVTSANYSATISVTQVVGLPNKTFWVNYNAKKYNSTTLTLPKENGQLFNEDLVLPGAVTFNNDYITITGDKRIHFAFNNTSDNIFNRTINTANVTIIAKVSPTNSTWFFSNRNGNSAVGMLVGLGRKYQMSWTGDDNAYTSSTSPMIFTWRCGNGTQQYIAHSDNVTGTPYTTTAWVGQEANNVYFFGGNSGSESWAGDFYWLYMSPETLTDAEIQQVIDYNENL